MTADAMRLRAVLNKLEGLKGEEKSKAMTAELAKAVPEQWQKGEEPKKAKAEKPEQAEKPEKPTIPPRVQDGFRRMAVPLQEIARGMASARELGTRYAAEYMNKDRAKEVADTLDRIASRVESIPDPGKREAAKDFLKTVVPPVGDITMTGEEAGFFGEPQAEEPKKKRGTKRKDSENPMLDLLKKGATRVGGIDYSIQQTQEGDGYYWQKVQDGVRTQKGPGFPAKWDRSKAIDQLLKEIDSDNPPTTEEKAAIEERQREAGRTIKDRTGKALMEKILALDEEPATESTEVQESEAEAIIEEEGAPAPEETSDAERRPEQDTGTDDRRDTRGRTEQPGGGGAAESVLQRDTDAGAKRGEAGDRVSPGDAGRGDAGTGRQGGTGVRGGRGTGNRGTAADATGRVPGGDAGAVESLTETPSPEVTLGAKAKDAESRALEAGENFSLDQVEDLGKGGPLTKARANIEALRAVKAIQRDRRKPTHEEQQAIARYVGFGDVAIRQQLFPTSGEPKGSWADIRNELDQMLTAEEMAEVKRSTQYAHYTSRDVVDGIYLGLQRLGVAEGLAFEAGVGSGNFIGLVPKGMNLRYTGIEREPIAAGVAQGLYPEAAILQADFTRVAIPDNYYDVVVGNPPFANTPITADKKYASYKFTIHNYFIAKQIDAVRPGGVMAVVVTHSFMDAAGSKARRYIAKQADLIGGVRLPNTAFEKNAGTKVTTDVLFFRKRGEKQEPGGHDWMGMAEVPTQDGATAVNEYFAANPQQVLGRHSLRGELTAKEQEYTVQPYPDRNLSQQVAKAIEALPEAVYTPIAKPTLDERASRFELNPAAKVNAYYMKGGEVWQALEGVGRKVTRNQAKARDYIPLRDAYNNVLAAQKRGEDSTAEQAKLLKAWTRFTKKHGALSREYTKERKDGKKITYTPNETALSLDPDFYRVQAAEKYDPVTDTAKPGPV
ncbi:MAG: N-6 DNA methylase, partial [Acidimicrobiia bacterium]|nr:N-6 DNA methylase [Acidimicrobiia bacterium]